MSVNRAWKAGWTKQEALAGFSGPSDLAPGMQKKYNDDNVYGIYHNSRIVLILQSFESLKSIPAFIDLDGMIVKAL